MKTFRILITGTSRGLGQRLQQRFTGAQFEVIGVSRRDDYDISTPEGRRRIVEKCENVDTIINNAHSSYGQTLLLFDLFEKFHSTQKLIINIGSNSSDGIKNYPHPYAIEKASLDKACEQLQNCKSQLRVSLLRFGWLDTERVRSLTDEPKISLDQAVDVIEWLIRQPSEINVNSLTVVPKM